MLKIRVIIFAFIFLSAWTYCFSQPSTTLHFLGGYSIPMGDMKGKFGSTRETFTVNEDSNTYYLQNGFNFGMDFKYSPLKKRGFKIIGGVHFNSFSQGTQYSDTVVSVQIDYVMRIITVALGLEYSYITKRSKINPFVNAQFTTNLFSGNYDETYSNGATTNLTLNATTRFGFQFGGGVDVPLGQRLGAIAGFKYNMANLIGKESTGDFGDRYSLNDKEGVVNNTKYINKSINFLYIYAGFTLYLGL